MKGEQKVLLLIIFYSILSTNTQTCGDQCCNSKTHHCCSSRCCHRQTQPICCGGIDDPGCCPSTHRVCCKPALKGCCRDLYPVCCPPDGCCPYGTKCAPNRKCFLLDGTLIDAFQANIQNNTTIPIYSKCLHDLVLQNLDTNTRVYENTIVYISEQGIYPNLVARICTEENIEWKLIIRFMSFRKELTSKEKNWNIRDSIGNDFVGGNVSLTLEASTKRYQMNFEIRGINPSHQLIYEAIGENPWYAKRIASHESDGVCGGPGPRQFTNEGLPCVGRNVPHGYGLFQITYNVRMADIWSWRENVLHGLNFINHNTNEANVWMKRQRDEALREMGRVIDVPDEIVGLCAFRERTSTPIEHAVAIKMYNGATKHYCSWKTGKGHWEFNRFNTNGTINYVARVCK